jgi:hypothetical protein
LCDREHIEIHIKITANIYKMSNKSVLIQNIRDWIAMDNEIRELNKELRLRKSKQKKISETLLTTMKENQIDEFDITGGKIMYNKTTSKKPITKKNLIGILSKYYKGDISQAIEMNSFIMNNRDEVTKETISRKIDKL